MKYNSALPYFFEEDIQDILAKFGDILRGKGLLSMGKNVKEFEKQFSNYVQTEYAIATSSCTTALEAVLSAIDLSPSDEVIIPAQTFIATASSVVRMGAKPVFCGIDEDHLLDIDHVLKSITPKTKAVIIVHFAGMIHESIFDLKKILNEKGIILIEDAAHATGANIRGVQAGNLGDIACFSFFSTKIITTGEGGMIATNSSEFSYLCSGIRDRGRDQKSTQEQFNLIGSNSRMTEFQAILGISQLNQLDRFIKHRNQLARTYRKKLETLIANGDISVQNPGQKTYHSYWRFVINIKNGPDREKLKRDLEKSSISIDWPYAPQVHLQPIFRKLYGNDIGMLKRTEKLTNNHICLPIHYGITVDDAKLISERFLEAFLS